jgi:hypothetical protein
MSIMRLPSVKDLFFEKLGKILSAIMPELIINFAPVSRDKETFSINTFIF